MRCKNCDYLLWNLPSRSCPECGKAFRPSDFRFRPSSVKFLCPHCDQAYYGTDKNGHLSPLSFTCTACHQPTHMDEMVIVAAEGYNEQDGERDRSPWLRRKTVGGLRSWFSMVGLAMVGPSRLMRMTPVESSMKSAWWFAIFTMVLIGFVFSLPFTLLGTLFGGSGAGFVLELLKVFLVMLLAALAVALPMMAIWGLVTHGILRATGPTSGTLRRTYQGICYSTGASVLTATPCLGVYFGWIWWLVSAVLMTKEAQRVSGGRAALAVLAMPVAVIGTLVVAYFGAIAAVLSGGFATGAFTSASETQTVLTAVMSYADDHQGAGPAHAGQLVVDGYLGSYDLIATETLTDDPDVPIGSITLADLGDLSVKRAKIVLAEAALPDDTVAHRLGDFVYTWHGVNTRTAPSALWLVIWSPDPAINPPRTAVDTVTVGMADGTVLEIASPNFPSALASQNALRATAGLAPIPDPATVTHSKPVVSQVPALP